MVFESRAFFLLKGSAIWTLGVLLGRRLGVLLRLFIRLRLPKLLLMRLAMMIRWVGVRWRGRRFRRRRWCRLFLLIRLLMGWVRWFVSVVDVGLRLS